MEKVKEIEFQIKDWILTSDDDFSELVVRFTDEPARPAISVLVNDDTQESYEVYLNVDEKTNEITAGFVIYVDEMFRELARAFADKDLNHPDVRFFLEKKLELYAQRHRDELAPQQSSIFTYKTPTS